MKKTYLFILIIGNVFFTQAQIGSGKTNDREATIVPKRIPTDGINEFTIYLGAGAANTFRKLESNDAPFGDPLGLRESETNVKIWTYQVGVRNRVSNWFSYDAGMSLDRFGEQFSYEASSKDSSLQFSNKYAYVALPVQGFLTYGKDFRWFIGGGLVPQLIAAHTYEEKTLSTKGIQTEINRSTVDDMNGFNLSAIVSGGVQWRWNSLFSVYCLPSYTWGLTNSYQKQEPYKHYVRGFNLKFGLAFHLPTAK